MVSEETHGKIIKSATKLFLEHGCKRITMDGIANELHISKRTLYEHFERKEDLLMACLDNIKENFFKAKQLFQQKNDSPIIMLLFLFKNSAGYNRRMSLLFSDIQSYYPDIYKKFSQPTTSEYANFIKKTLMNAESRGDLRQNVDIELSTTLLVHFLSKMNFERHIDTRTEQNAIEMVSEGGFTFVRGLLSVEAIQRYDAQEEKIRDLTNACYENL